MSKSNVLSPKVFSSQSRTSPKAAGNPGFGFSNSQKAKVTALSQNGISYPTKSATQSYKSSFVSTADKSDFAGHERRASEYSDKGNSQPTVTSKTLINSPKFLQAGKLFQAQRVPTAKKDQSTGREPQKSSSPNSALNRPRTATDTATTSTKTFRKDLQINTDLEPQKFPDNPKSQTTKNKPAELAGDTNSNPSTPANFSTRTAARTNTGSRNVVSQSLQLTSTRPLSKGKTNLRQSTDSMTSKAGSMVENGTPNKFYSVSKEKKSPTQKISSTKKPLSVQSTRGSSTTTNNFFKFDASKLKSSQLNGNKGKNLTKSTLNDEYKLAVTKTEPDESKRVLHTEGSTRPTTASKITNSSEVATSKNQKSQQSMQSLYNSLKNLPYKPTGMKISATNEKPAGATNRGSEQVIKVNPPASTTNKSEPISLDSFVTKVNKGEIFGGSKIQQNNPTMKKNTNLTIEDPTKGRAGGEVTALKTAPKTTTNASLGGKSTAIHTKDTKNGQQPTIEITIESAKSLSASKSDGKTLKTFGSFIKEEANQKGKQEKPQFTYYVTSLEKSHRCPDETDYFNQLYLEHFIQTYQAMLFCKFMKPADPQQLEAKKVYLPKRETHKDKKTLVFDLDETLIHCNESNDMESDVILPIVFPQGEVIEAGINVRPYALEALKELSSYYEIIVFTASHSCYANVVLDYLDPKGQYIHHRLFRDNCIQTEEGIYIKDLRVLANRNLNEVVLVDNAAYSFGYQVENGIPIIPFYNNYEDEELKHLIPYLKQLAKAKDLREINRDTFKFHMYTLFDHPHKVVEKVILNL